MAIETVRKPLPDAPLPAPSALYQKRVATYADMHVNGDPGNGVPADKLFDGRGLPLHIEVIRQLCARFGVRTLLDYGCGKAKPYSVTRIRSAEGQPDRSLQEVWGLEQVALYDPAVRAFAELPEGRFDAVLATHVLEFTPEPDVGWVLAELFAYARSLLFVAIACHASPYELPGGGNYHATQRSAGWWTDQLWAARRWTPKTRCFALLYPEPDSRILVEI